MYSGWVLDVWRGFPPRSVVAIECSGVYIYMCVCLHVSSTNYVDSENCQVLEEQLAVAKAERERASIAVAELQQRVSVQEAELTKLAAALRTAESVEVQCPLCRCFSE